MPLLSLRLSLLLGLAAAAVLAVCANVVQGSPPRPSAALAATSATTRALPARPVRVKPTRSSRLTKPRKVKPKPKQTAVTPEPPVVPNDPLWAASWSLAKVGAPEAWRSTTGSPDVIVAVLDTGIDAQHPDLRGAVLPGWDAVNEDADASDDHGHGTAVAGIIAARSNNGEGVTGACWRCALMPVKVIAADGTGSASDIAEGIVWAADHGATVLNLSFVLSGYDGAVAGAIDYARAKGALVVAAAGNAGNGDPTFPASHPGVIGVTATDAGDGRYPWASYGSWVAVAAPGCSQSTFPGGGYGEFCGTSSAAAFASGIVALVRSAAGASEVTQKLLDSAVGIGDGVASGRIDAAGALSSGRTPAAAAPEGNRPDRPEPRPDRL